MNKSEVQAHFKLKRTPSKTTAIQWMTAMKYRYGKEKNGMYIDGHERDDVVKYRKNIFLPFWTKIESQMMIWNQENEVTVPQLTEFPQKKKVVLITHDESTFYANDRKKTRWVHETEKATTNPKGEGASIMVSDFCSPDLGWLCSKDGKEEAQVFFKAGKGRDGYFTNEDLLVQTEKAIELFEDNFPGNAIAVWF